jgi:2-polyprenyl-3-methyl-5-hydroxy-6-metoxy-1,4-benzoquinol methylase
MTLTILDLGRKIIARFFRIITPHKRSVLFSYILAAGADPSSPKDALQFYMGLDNRLYNLEGEAAVAYGKGIHPKHWLTRYHEFFINNITPDERVLDIGCGNGSLAYDLVTKGNARYVLGIDMNKENILYAEVHYQHLGLSFLLGDALTDLPDTHFNTIILSNVLEHIRERIVFLKVLQEKVGPKKILFRVPLVDRDWRVPLKRELGIEYRLDLTNEIEYTQEEFLEELHQAHLSPTYLAYHWGEIWCVAVPAGENIS